MKTKRATQPKAAARKKPATKTRVTKARASSGEGKPVKAAKPTKAIKATKPAKAAKTPKPAKGAKAKPDGWNLRLYVAGQTARSVAAFSNLKRICEERLAGHYNIEVVDLLKQPQLAQGDQIIAIPTLVRKLPEPIKRVVGDLSNLERVLVGMDLQELRPA